MLATSYQFKKGYRIRIALAGADKDHFQVLDDPAPVWDSGTPPEQFSQIGLLVGLKVQAPAVYEEQIFISLFTKPEAKHLQKKGIN